MNPIAEILLEEVAYAQKLAQRILTLSGLNDDGVIYSFATSDTLVINCRDYQTTWRFEEELIELYLGIAKLNSSIQTILIEKAGKPFYCW
ncbi:MAG TPA: hypothetical protein DEG17_17545 [Cyanobacteria bacterium UBA11149]|nr:hypothetical protein [Cyanobacteria bacterium UBA11367]HBE58601.1 hypothetical protein [Cyanobacteria bacterium UBA11366]HBK65800.1 hypothetical protein [Cyanobacteria bacterium UBA11166]HBW90626.1 hypothetical protein [Cyanobacteria bacterium UBA11149]HCA98209.1 hypothetical protein [Cyanobacteria bacterium UBA9226]